MLGFAFHLLPVDLTTVLFKPTCKFSSHWKVKENSMLLDRLLLMNIYICFLGIARK